VTTLLKVCGATGAADVDALAEAGAHLVGLWHGVAGGHAELPVERLAALAGRARRRRVEPVLVTFLDDADTLGAIVAATGVRWVQLHAYQPPGLVKALKRRVQGLTVVKVLHVVGTRCLELRFLGAYERAGADLVLVDRATEDGQVGSTGAAVPLRAAGEVADRATRPFLLAGGVTAAGRARYAPLARHPRFRGIDVDTAARDASGRLSVARVRAIGQAWLDDRAEEASA
jgi:phosphoribosylanthranilate isomerase